MDKKQKKKLIAPIIIIVILVAYIIGWSICWSLIPFPVFVKIAGLIIAGAIIAVIIYVLAERIEEIRSGEEDDISKY